MWMVFGNPKCSSLLIKHQTRELKDCCNINLKMCRFEKQVITQNHTPNRYRHALSPGTRTAMLCRPNRPLKWLWKSSIFPNFHRLEKYKIYLCFSGGGDLSIPHVFGLIGSPQSDPMGYLNSWQIGTSTCGEVSKKKTDFLTITSHFCYQSWQNRICIFIILVWIISNFSVEHFFHRFVKGIPI